MQLKRDKRYIMIAIFNSNCIAFALLIGVFLPSCDSNKTKKKAESTQPALLSDSMQGKSEEYLERLEIPFDDNKILSSLPVIHPEQKSIEQKLTVDGVISYDTREEENISARYGGRIEKLYVKYMYQPIKKGDLLFEIYSPEMLTEQNNLLFLLDENSMEKELIESSKKKLLFQGMTRTQITELIKTRKPFYRIPVYSPTEGHIHETHVIANSMQSNSLNATNMDELSIKEGMYVQKGQTIFNILDPHKIWAVLKFYADDARKIKLNQHVQLTLEGLIGDTLSGKIDFIEPILRTDSKTFSARVYLSNPTHKLKVGMYLKATIDADSILGLWIPKAAVLDLGKQKIVWLKEEKYFTAHTIKTGITSGNLIQVTSGLSETNNIASNAEYIADSESFIKPK